MLPAGLRGLPRLNRLLGQMSALPRRLCSATSLARSPSGAIIHPGALSWNDRLVVRLAQAIYEERRWRDLPILHDALLDAGCDNEDILAHCKSAGPHVRGCWVIDRLLAKE